MIPLPEFLWDGPIDAKRTVLLAHSAGLPRSQPILTAFAKGLAARGLRVARFDYPYMQAMRDGVRRAPDSLASLLLFHRAAIAATLVRPDQLILAGKSMGGRISTLLADETGCAGVIAIGYPFHPPQKPTQLRTKHLATIRTRCLFLQGERDALGSRAEVSAYQLSAAITLHWFTDGDHSLIPRLRSGHTSIEHLEKAIATSASFALS
ncbi:MAG: alpha/beta hydrolase [Planctomycetes bacterium]|nr:alpha/beta hydrolase [Planctomycetota bacterium]